ncbi:hypothetical protein AAMO2058_000142400 [Amorphochlora amoebiformis]
MADNPTATPTGREVRLGINKMKIRRTNRKTSGGSTLHVVIRLMRSNWFILSVFGCIYLAKLAPWVGVKGGPLKPEITVKYFGVGLIFLMSGLSLKTEELRKAAMNVKVHAVIQGFSLLFTPLMVCTLAGFVETSAFPLYGISRASDLFALLMGIKVLSCLPPPVSTGLILTKEVGGNDAIAIFNGTIGAFMGVFVTPMLVYKLTGGSADLPIVSIVSKLSITVVTPLLAGQAIKYSNIVAAKTLKSIPFSFFRSLILLTIIYTTFCATFTKELDISMGFFLGLVVILLALQLFNMLLVKNVGSLQNFQRTDTVACMFCAVHKSLTLGMPITGIVFEGSPKLAIITIPLLVYHPMQILLGTLLVGTLKNWVKADRIRTRAPGSRKG